jgi:hypothetical protein
MEGKNMNQVNRVLSVRSSVQLPSATSPVFVIDEDKFVRESLESLIAAAEWVDAREVVHAHCPNL